MDKHDIGINKIYDNDLSFYKEFIKQLKIPVLLSDKDGNIIFANRAALLLTGYTEQEVTKLHFDDLFIADTPRAFEHLKNIGKLECKIKIMHQEQATIPATLKIYNYHHNDKRKHYFQIILKDFYMDEHLDNLKKPLQELSYYLSNFNDKLEKLLENIKKEDRDAAGNK